LVAALVQLFFNLRQELFLGLNESGFILLIKIYFGSVLQVPIDKLIELSRILILLFTNLKRHRWIDVNDLLVLLRLKHCTNSTLFWFSIRNIENWLCVTAVSLQLSSEWPYMTRLWTLLLRRIVLLISYMWNFLKLSFFFTHRKSCLDMRICWSNSFRFQLSIQESLWIFSIVECLAWRISVRTLGNCTL